MQAFCTVHNRNDAPKSHCCQTNLKFMCACSQWISAQSPCPYTLFAQWTETAFICTNNVQRTANTFETITHASIPMEGAQRSERARKSSDSKNITINTNSWSVNTHIHTIHARHYCGIKAHFYISICNFSIILWFNKENLIIQITERKYQPWKNMAWES